MTQQPKEHQIDGADLKAIEDFIYSTMNHTREWELAENAYQRILTVRSRPHPAPTDEQCRICSQATAKAAREDALNEFMMAIESIKINLAGCGV